LRLLLVSDLYPPCIGGAARSTRLLARGLASRGHTVSVATPWQPDSPEREDDGGVAVHRVRSLTTRVSLFSANPARRRHPPFPDPETVWRLRRLVSQLHPDLVHAYGWMAYSCVLALLGLGVPLLLAARDYGYVCPVHTLVRRGHICDGPAVVKCLGCAPRTLGVAKGILAVAGVLTGRGLLRHRARGIHSVSAYVQETLQRHLLGGRSEKSCVSGGGESAPGRQRATRVIHSFGDESADGPPDPGILARLPAAPYILFVGALRAVKGIQQLLDAYAQLDAPPALVIIGTRHLGAPAALPPGITVLYDVPHATVMAAWAGALFGVAPSTWAEPSGNVVHEAMSRGKAVIGTTPGGHAEMVVHEETGLLVPTADVGALAAAMQRLIDDRDLRERLGQAAARRARLFTAEVVLPRFEALYAEILAGAGSA
jgi:glycosyltransferase involved in cell wall biosynthesis